MPSFYPCPCHPSGKRSGSLSLSLSLFLSPLSVSLSDERGAMIASTTKGPAACVWMRLSFLLSFLLLLLYLSLLTPSDLTYSLFPLCCPPYPSSPPPTLSLHSCSISRCLMPVTGVAAPFFVRASAIQSGDGIKNQKVSLSKRHPGWRTLMSPRKFEIHMLSHFILFPPSLPLSRSFSFCFLLFFVFLRQAPSCTIQLEREKRGEGRRT